MLTLERLREVLAYDPETGLLKWVGRTGKKSKPGKVAGSLDNNGYVVIRIDRKIYKAHRLAWMLMTGNWPKVTIDHINNAPADNRWSNLREATYSQNNANRGLTSLNTSGLKGVSRHSQNGRWVAQMNGKYIGIFDDQFAAYEAYKAEAIKVYGPFARFE